MINVTSLTDSDLDFLIKAAQAEKRRRVDQAESERKRREQDEEDRKRRQEDNDLNLTSIITPSVFDSGPTLDSGNTGSDFGGFDGGSGGGAGASGDW
jgi:hypothetical protein